ncbi:hypothetical protein ACJZ2D_004656 [Fusarium nematophilum]
MSNQLVGNVYQAIIDEVINSSRVDFEESGVEESVLEELRQGWQRKLTQLDVARFPWDPKPDPPPPAQAAPPPTAAAPTHAQAQFSPQLNVPQGLSLPGVNQPQGQNGIKPEANYVKTESAAPIKQEAGAQGNSLPYQAYNSMDGKSNVAVNRAAQQLQAQYGQRAASSINALHQQQQPQLPAAQQQGPAPQQQQQPGQQPTMTQQQQMYRQQMAATTAHQQQQQSANVQPHIRNGQTDGGSDMDGFEGVLMERGASGDLRELGTVEIDRMLHERILANAKSMEGGGLMCTLKDGVLTVNGKEYVFHKATGEYEW